MRTSTPVLALLFALAHTSAGLTTVDELDVTKYQGRWYQMYADLFVVSTFERNGVCVVADYALDSNCELKNGETVESCIRLVNTQRDTTITGEKSNVTGTAHVPDSTEPGQLLVDFDPPVPQFVSAPYWVIALGEETEDGMYSYSVVSDNLGQSLFVLARDVDEFNSKYDDEVKAILEANGFTGFLYGPRATTQEGCSYDSATVKGVEGECVKEYKIDDNMCGEVCVSSTIAPFAEKFGGVTKGTCADEGYTVYDHTESVDLGPFGTTDTDIYTKPEAVDMVKSSSYCPGSEVYIHASCDLSLSFDAPCSDVKEELEARVGGQYAAWHDPHNNGTYTILGGADTDLIELQRVTGNLKYTDKINYAFETTSAGGCSVNACSESQVQSILDYSTNYCNILNLVCGSDFGCSPLVHDLTFSKDIHSCMTHDDSACVVA